MAGLLVRAIFQFFRLIRGSSTQQVLHLLRILFTLILFTFDSQIKNMCPTRHTQGKLNRIQTPLRSICTGYLQLPVGKTK